MTAVGIKYNLFYGNGEMEFVLVLKTFTIDQEAVRLIARYKIYTTIIGSLSSTMWQVCNYFDMSIQIIIIIIFIFVFLFL